jgi:hypothetical protein
MTKNGRPPAACVTSSRTSAVSTSWCSEHEAHVVKANSTLCTEIDTPQGQHLGFQSCSIQNLTRSRFCRVIYFCDSDSAALNGCMQISPLSDDFLSNYCSCLTYFKAYQPPHHSRSNHARRGRQVFDICVLIICGTLFGYLKT